MSKNVLVLIPVSEKHKRLLEENAPSASFTYKDSNEIDTTLEPEEWKNR